MDGQSTDLVLVHARRSRRAARFLCSPAAGFVTGQIVHVNGGFRSA